MTPRLGAKAYIAQKRSNPKKSISFVTTPKAKLAESPETSPITRITVLGEVQIHVFLSCIYCSPQ